MVKLENGDVAVRYYYMYKRLEEALIHIIIFDYVILAISIA
jgi:hypothetical protein